MKYIETYINGCSSGEYHTFDGESFIYFKDGIMHELHKFQENLECTDKDIIFCADAINMHNINALDTVANQYSHIWLKAISEHGANCLSMMLNEYVYFDCYMEIRINEWYCITLDEEKHIPIVSMLSEGLQYVDNLLKILNKKE